MSDDKMVNNGGDDDGDDNYFSYLSDNNTRTIKVLVNSHDRVVVARLFHPSYL